MHNGQSELAGELENAFGDGTNFIPWRMPDSLVRHDRKGRVVKTGGTKGNIELAEKISAIFNKKIVWATIGDFLQVNGAVVREEPKKRKIHELAGHGGARALFGKKERRSVQQKACIPAQAKDIVCFAFDTQPDQNRNPLTGMIPSFSILAQKYLLKLRHIRSSNFLS